MIRKKTNHPEALDYALEMASYDPKHFRDLVKTFCKDVTEHQAVKAMQAWQINPEKLGPITGDNYQNSSGRSSGHRKNYRNKRIHK